PHSFPTRRSSDLTSGPQRGHDQPRHGLSQPRGSRPRRMGHPQTRTQTGSPPNNENLATIIPVRLFHRIVESASLNAYTQPFFQAAFMPLDRGKVFTHIDKNL